MDRQQIRADIDFGTYTEINETLASFRAHLDRLAASIGATAETANVWMEYESDPWDGGGSINAYVWRWETDEEAAGREERERLASEESRRAYAAQQEARERATYEALRAKYG